MPLKSCGCRDGAVGGCAGALVYAIGQQPVGELTMAHCIPFPMLRQPYPALRIYPIMYLMSVCKHRPRSNRVPSALLQREDAGPGSTSSSDLRHPERSRSPRGAPPASLHVKPRATHGVNGVRTSRQQDARVGMHSRRLASDSEIIAGFTSCYLCEDGFTSAPTREPDDSKDGGAPGQRAPDRWTR